MATKKVTPSQVDLDELRRKVQAKYAEVADNPDAGFRFQTGYSLASFLEYEDDEVYQLPIETVTAFAGSGNPFALGPLHAGEAVLDIGCGAGFDTLLAAAKVGPTGRVIGVDMTEAMLSKAAAGAKQLGLENVTTKLGYAESLWVRMSRLT